MTVTDYTMKIEEIYDSLGSINVSVHEKEMVQIFLSSKVRADPDDYLQIGAFFDLQSMLMVEDNHVGASRTTQSDC